MKFLISMPAAVPLITGNIYHKKFNGKIKPRKVTFGSLSSEGKHYIDIYHATKPKQKFQIKIDQENFAGIETGDTVLQTGVIRRRVRPSKYFAIILKKDIVLFHIDDNCLEKWQKTICTALNHKAAWNGKLIQPNQLLNTSLQLMNTVVTIIDKATEPRCFKWWRIDDIEKIYTLDNTDLILQHRTEGTIRFQPEHGLQIIYEDLKDLAAVNCIVAVPEPPVVHPSPPPCDDPSPEPIERPSWSLRRSSSVAVHATEFEVNPQYHNSKRRVSIKGKPIDNPYSLQVPPVDEGQGLTSRAMSDPNIYYNELDFTAEICNRQVSEDFTPKRSDSISQFYEGEYDYSSPVMNFVYYFLCKRREDSVPNLLQIGGITRRKLGLKLFNVSTPETGSWKDLATELCEMSVQDADNFSCLRQQQLCTHGLTETEMILKYWEHMASTDDELYRSNFKYPCSRNELISLLRYLNREDLADLIQRSAIR